MRIVLIITAILFAFVSLARHFPLAWVGAALPEGVGTYSGTVWNGQVRDVPLLGSLSVDARLIGATLATAPGDVVLSGDVTPGGVTDLVLALPIARLPIADNRLQGLGGRVSLRVAEAVIADGMCISARGTASTNVLAANRARFDWSGPELSGPVDCANGQLRVRLSGEDSAQRVEADVRIGPDGAYAADISVSTADPAAGSVLSLFGFSPGGNDSYGLSEQGRWR